MAHALADDLRNAERDLDDARSEQEDAGREVRRMRDRLEELRQSVKPRQAVSGGQYFEIDGEVYRRVHDRQQNFGGSVGVCLRAQRMRLGIAEGVLEAAADAEWLQTSGDCRAFASENEARGFLIDAEEGD